MAKKYSKSQSIAVYERTISITRDAGTTRNGDQVFIPAHNVSTLDSHIPTTSLRTDSRYDWKSGKTTQVPQDVLEKAQRHISTLKLSHPATSGFRQRREQADMKRNGNGDGDGNGCCPSPYYYGHPGSPVPLSGGGKKNRDR
jgi:hypothetical protein